MLLFIFFSYWKQPTRNEWHRFLVTSAAGLDFSLLSRMGLTWQAPHTHTHTHNNSRRLHARLHVENIGDSQPNRCSPITYCSGEPMPASCSSPREGLSARSLFMFFSSPCLVSSGSCVCQYLNAGCVSFCGQLTSQECVINFSKPSRPSVYGA